MIRLADLDTRAPKDADKDKIKRATQKLVERIAERQDRLFAQRQHSLLVVLQGMDASGKDGTARAVFAGVNPVGLHAVSFVKPTPEELAHDFLWRVHRHAPAKGYIQLFIRSHYEDVLVQKVNGWIDADRARERYRAINAFERLLVKDAGTVIVKCFLHTSKEDQYKELRERLEDPTKQWKHNDGDWTERRRWNAYQSAYQAAINRTNTPEAPWTVVPADQAWYRNYVVALAVADALDRLSLDYPRLPDETVQRFLAIKG